MSGATLNLIPHTARTQNAYLFVYTTNNSLNFIIHLLNHDEHRDKKVKQKFFPYLNIEKFDVNLQ